MSERKEYVLGLMRRQARAKRDRLGKDLAATRQKEMLEFDLAERIGTILDQTQAPQAQPDRIGELTSIGFMTRRLVEQLESSSKRYASPTLTRSSKLQKELMCLEFKANGYLRDKQNKMAPNLQRIL